MVLHARVKAGRYVIDEPADLPDGAVVELVAIDELLEPEERDALRASIEKGLAEGDRGLAIPAEEVLRRLRAK